MIANRQIIINYNMLLLKIFSLLELQLNVLLLRSKLVKYISIALLLLYYNCVRVKLCLIQNPFYVCCIGDFVSVPLYVYMASSLFYLARTLTSRRSYYYWPLSFYIISYLTGIFTIIDYPVLLIARLLNIKYKYKMMRLPIHLELNNYTIKKTFHIQMLKMRMLQYFLLFKRF